MQQIEEKSKPYPFKLGCQNDRICQYLLSGKRLKNYEFREKFNVLAYNQRISEIRQHGFDVHCEQIGDSGVWVYWIPKISKTQGATE